MGSSYSTNHVEEHEVITALKETLSAAATDSDACDAVKGAISKLTEQDFEDAIRTGSGLYVDILKESEAAGFGGGLVPMKDMKKAAGKKQQLVNGHLQNIVRRDWKQVAENVIPTKAFGVVSVVVVISCCFCHCQLITACSPVSDSINQTFSSRIRQA